MKTTKNKMDVNLNMSKIAKEDYFLTTLITVNKRAYFAHIWMDKRSWF